MKQVVVFTEGQGELIFIRNILIQMLGFEDLSFECFALNSDRLLSVAYTSKPPNAIIHFQIIIVGNDEKVLTEVRDRHERFLERGFEIIGLRDMYSDRYQKSSAVVNQEVNNSFLEAAAAIIGGLNNEGKIHFFFAIMELEAWLLGMYEVLERIDQSLTLDNIREQLGFDLQVIDPEMVFFHPALDFAQVLGLASIYYDKSEHRMESIVSRISLDDINSLVASQRCNSFALLISEFQRQIHKARAAAG